ncbi:cysteine--tRNA ligase [Candidatus Uhrbacteria bacterium]|nr:cysteine--tRNA ligase [Candidatus Uhrbacteria bacterium]
MSLKLYNTLTRKKEVFRPHKGNTVTLYTCGPTVYNFVHIGNLRTYVFEDFLKRTLLAQGWRVTHVMNITDVGHLTDDADDGEDKVERAAAKQQMSAWQLSAFYTKAFEHDIAQLNITPPMVWCKATDYIQEQVKLIQTLEKKGVAYRLEDGIYFDTSQFPSYGRLARLDMKGLKAGARIEVAQGKRNPTDFALWKLSTPQGTHPEPIGKSHPKTKRQMEWPSPWGVGFPGWHIECSAMSMALLKLPIDIHCGGIDHIPVHHTNEIAQSEAATGKQFVRVWMHGAFLTIKKGKMAKSEGNFLTLSTLQDQGFDPLSYRYLLTTAHYRKALDFSNQSLEAAQESYRHLKNSLRQRGIFKTKTTKRPSSKAKKQWMAFLNAINDDLNIPEAMAVVWQSVRMTAIDLPSLKWLIEEMDHILGLDLTKPDHEAIPEDIQQMVARREQARRDKQWTRADELRRLIEHSGYRIEDSSTGARVTFTGRPHSTA